ncbi:hypothetical protein SAMN02982919_00458 [Giesbergeria anulus]|uniref:Uncharacterized protein n=1 Tax=Giesbergeria anulus TaxID=180197 RepID=A0A1H9F5B7_9BURK|nr:hypothetical protein SAMN02982919_00458 [Giesbergeria anulus]
MCPMVAQLACARWRVLQSDCTPPHVSYWNTRYIAENRCALQVPKLVLLAMYSRTPQPTGQHYQKSRPVNAALSWQCGPKSAKTMYPWLRSGYTSTTNKKATPEEVANLLFLLVPER